MTPLLDELWELPIAELERHGLDKRTIMTLEATVGLYVGDLAGMTAQQLRRLPLLAGKRVMFLRQALQNYITHRETVHANDDHR